MEWSLPSPPKHGNWEEIPTVYHGPYEYSHPAVDRDWLLQNERPDVVSPAHEVTIRQGEA
jgi:cytochrome c oxidase subunit 1